MSRRLILILALAFVVGIAFAAYAEVQNVKVSGDITVMGVYRNNQDLAKERSLVPNVPGWTTIVNTDTLRNALSIVRVRVDADLTDNVSTTVRLINERVWGQETDTDTYNPTTFIATTTSSGSANVDIDLAYATMKEFLYSPLTLTVGRQELHFGNDMIVGARNTNGVALGSNLPLYEQDLSSRKSFDAVRATLNYDPLVIDAIWSKVGEGSLAVNDDTDLYGINAHYALDKVTNLEGYFFAKVTQSGSGVWNAPWTAFVDPTTNKVNKADQVYAVGGKFDSAAVKNLWLSLEAAFQFGTWNPSFDINSNYNGISTCLQRRAWALEAMAIYDLKDIARIAKYAPSLTASYTYMSGDNASEKASVNSSKWHGWDSMFINQIAGHLATSMFAATNSHIVGLSGKMEPVKDITFNLDYVYIWLDKAYAGIENNFDVVNMKGAPMNFGSNYYLMTHNRHFGQEIDAKLTYAYTEDVQFSLLGGLFLPGSAFAKNVNPAIGLTFAAGGNRNVASEVIGSMKVTF